MSAQTYENPNYALNEGMRPMLALSAILHIVAFLSLIIIPESFSIREVDRIVYEVNLVELPSSGKFTSSAPSSDGPAKKTTVPKSTHATRLKPSKKIEAPKIIAPKTATRTTSTKKDDPSDLIDKAISEKEEIVETEDNKIDHLADALADLEKEVKSQKTPSADSSHLDKALADIQKSAKARGRETVRTGGTVITGPVIDIYRAEVTALIYSNWHYPVALQNRDLEAVVMLQVRNDGTIMKSWMERRSNNIIFDQSALKAIERTGTLLPFPENLRISYEEFQITFNLRDLED